jgi:hypothetical protein
LTPSKSGLERFQTLPVLFQTLLFLGSRGFTKKGSNILERFQTLPVFQTQQVFRGFTKKGSNLLERVQTLSVLFQTQQVFRG